MPKACCRRDGEEPLMNLDSGKDSVGFDDSIWLGAFPSDLYL